MTNKLYDGPVAIYNASEQKLIAIAKSQKQATLHIYGPTCPFRMQSRTMASLRFKHTILNSALGHKVAVRYANAEQKNMLGDKKIFILK